MGKIAVVTGASYGLGAAIAKQLLANSFKVYGISRTALKINNSHFVWIKADLTKPKELTAIANQIKEAKIDLLINNAGTAFTQKTLDYTDQSFEAVFGLNFKAPAQLTALLFPKIKHGLIINISSISDRYPDPDYGLYGSSKAALNLFFETLAAENPKIKVINVLPSYIDTPLQHQLNDQQNFDWRLCMATTEVAESISDLIVHQAKFSSGSRVAIVKDIKEFNGIYNPEQLWVYSTKSGQVKKVS